MRFLGRQTYFACSGDEMAPAAAGAHDVNVFERLALVAESKKVRMLDLFRMVSTLHSKLIQKSAISHTQVIMQSSKAVRGSVVFPLGGCVRAMYCPERLRGDGILSSACMQVDKHGRGWLKEAELYRLCALVVPDISPGQLRYLEVMLDHDGDGKVSFPDLQHLATISKRTGLEFSVKAQLDATDVLKKAAVFMYDKRLTIREFFSRFDDHNMVKLSKKAIATIVRVVMKAVSQAEAAMLVNEFVKVFDMDTDGFISYAEFQQAMAEGEPNQPHLEADWGAIDIRTDFENQGRSLTSNTLGRLKGEHSILRKVCSARLSSQQCMSDAAQHSPCAQNCTATAETMLHLGVYSG